MSYVIDWFVVCVTEGLMTLLQDIGRGYLALAQYDCKKAIQLLSSLPPHHLNTGWVKCQIGRAYYEMADYQKVRNLFYYYIIIIIMCHLYNLLYGRFGCSTQKT